MNNVLTPYGDRQTTMVAAYSVPCVLTTITGDTASTISTAIRLEMWRNPHTGVDEPFYAVHLDRATRRLYETSVVVTATQIVPEKPAPDWGGLDMEPLNLDISPQIPLAWALSLLATAVSLSLIVWWLRVAR